MIDSRGRLLGLINLIDLALVLSLVFAGALGVSAYRVFQLPAPVIERVEPATVAMGSDGPVRLVGRNFRHYLRVLASETGKPFAVTPTKPDALDVPIVVGASNVLELRVASLPAGTYDLYVFDNARELAHLPSAVTITPPALPQATIRLLVRFLLSAETAAQLHAGDRDATPAERAGAAAEDAEIEKLDVRSGAVDVMDLRLAQHSPDDRYLWMGTHTSQVLANAVVRVPVVEAAPGLWTYKGRTVRAGEDFFLSTASTAVRGTIVHRGEVEAKR